MSNVLSHSFFISTCRSGTASFPIYRASQFIGPIRHPPGISLASHKIANRTVRMLLSKAASQTAALPKKFADPDFAADGQRRARVPLHGLETLWFNTGTLCNIACENCYI